jgi:hypothetical protein
MVAVNMRMQPLRNNVRNARLPIRNSSGAAGCPPVAGEGAENFPRLFHSVFFPRGHAGKTALFRGVNAAFAMTGPARRGRRRSGFQRSVNKINEF